MIKTIISGGKKKASFRFKNKFSELTVGEFRRFMLKAEEIGKAIEEGAKLEEDLEELKKKTDVDITDEVILIDASLLSVDSRIRALKIEQLALLSGDYEKTVSYLMNTPGVTQKFIFKLWKNVQAGFGDFFSWFERVKARDKFRFSDYRKANFWSLTKITVFQVFDMDRTTVLRENAVATMAAKIDTFEGEFKENRWKNLPLFLAYVCRPAVEEFEITASRKNRKKAFFGGSQVAELSVADRLEGYNEKLEEVIPKREKIFDSLPLPLAFAVYKQYFFLSRR